MEKCERKEFLISVLQDFTREGGRPISFGEALEIAGLLKLSPLDGLEATGLPEKREYRTFVRLYWKAGGHNDYESMPEYEVAPHTRFDFVEVHRVAELKREIDALKAENSRLLDLLNRKCECGECESCLTRLMLEALASGGEGI